MSVSGSDCEPIIRTPTLDFPLTHTHALSLSHFTTLAWLSGERNEKAYITHRPTSLLLLRVLFKNEKLSKALRLSMARSWLIDSRAFAKKVKNAALSSTYQIKDSGANRKCPKCHYIIDNSDVFSEWPGLPAGVKFDPADTELLEHLAAKCGIEGSSVHMFINEFIPTLEGDQGICYTHPENLPGAKKDGSSVHFFHRTINAYATGHRKRRKIHNQHGLTEDGVRWHKTGKTKPVLENGVQKGFKKIMVLYKSSKKGSKPDKANWVMHQYHLGTKEDEKEGEYVVSKIFYQHPKQNEKNEGELGIEDPDGMTVRTSPRTPKVNPPDPPCPGKHVRYDNNALRSSPQEAKCISEVTNAPLVDIEVEDNMGYPAWLAGESQAVENCDLDSLDESLLCKEIFGSSSLLNDSIWNHSTSSGLCKDLHETGNKYNISSGIAELVNIELDTPPDFQLSNLQFGSQDSILDWLDRI